MKAGKSPSHRRRLFENWLKGQFMHYLPSRPRLDVFLRTGRMTRGKGLIELNRVAKQGMDSARSTTTHYPTDWKSQIGHFNLLMTFTRAVILHRGPPPMTFTFVDKGDCLQWQCEKIPVTLELPAPSPLLFGQEKRSAGIELCLEVENRL